MNKSNTVLENFYCLRNFYDSQIREILDAEREGRPPVLRERPRAEKEERPKETAIPIEVFRMRAEKGISIVAFMFYLLLLSLPGDFAISQESLLNEFFFDASLNTVRRKCRSLEEAGLLKIKQRGRSNFNTWVVYMPDKDGRMQLYKEFNKKS